MSKPGSLKVVVVDDNEDLVAATVALLRLAGHETKHCHNGLAVLDCVKAFDPDVVLLDINLPGMSGWDVAQQIRAHMPGKRPLIIGISGEFMKAIDKTRAEMQFDYFLVKPADPELVLALVSRAGG